MKTVAPEPAAGVPGVFSLAWLWLMVAVLRQSRTSYRSQS